MPVQFPFVPKPDGSLTAVVVSGGKQYRVAPGDRILVDRLAVEPGSSVNLGRVLLLHNGAEIKVGAPTLDGIDVEAKVIGHPRGPRIENLRYKSKKRVRVHRGGRADLTALEIIAVGGLTVATGTEVEAEEPTTGKTKPKPAGRKSKPAEASTAEDVDSEPEAKAEVKVEAKDEGRPARRAKPKTPKETK